VAFIRARVAVFVDGCFWHGCPKCYRSPSTNREYWDQKLTANRARDQRVTLQLESAGWAVMRFWEHDIEKDVEGCVQEVLAQLAKRTSA
jgi:DNA mismatch endonuclease, patch repair protein